MSFHYADEKVCIEMDSSNFSKHQLIFFANGVFQEPQRPISSETTFYWEYLPEEQMLGIQ